MKSLQILEILVIIGFIFYQSSEALQCYVCQNCMENEELQELHICGEIPIDIPATTTTIASASTKTNVTAAGSTTTQSSNSENEETEEDDYSEESDERHRTAKPNAEFDIINAIFSVFHTTEKPIIITTTIAATKTTATTTTKAAATATTTKAATATTTMWTTSPSPSVPDILGFWSSEEEAEIDKTTEDAKSEMVKGNDGKELNQEETNKDTAKPSNKPIASSNFDSDEYVDSDENIIRMVARSKNLSLLKQASEPVCYMVKIKVNDTIITNRGCTAMVNANNLLTCQSLYSAFTMEDCNLCDTNGCNRPKADDTDNDNDDGTWNAAASIFNLYRFYYLSASLLLSLFLFAYARN